MLDIAEIRKKLEDRNWQEVSRRTGVGYFYVRGVALGETAHPRHDVILALSEYLKKTDAS